MKPEVSILMPSYNYGRYIGKSINSVLRQSFHNWELIIVDDGSIDNSVDIINQYKDKRIRFYKQKNSGVTKTLNRAFSLSRGKYICFLDADDKYHPDKLKYQIESIKKGFGVVTTKVEAIDENGLKSPLDHFDITWNSYNAKKVFGKDILFEFLKRNYICKSSVMVRRSLFDKYGLFNEKLITAYDLDFWLRVVSHEKVNRCERYLTYYRWHNQNESAINNNRIRVEVLLIMDKYVSSMRLKEEQNDLLNKYVDSISICLEDNNLCKGYLALQIIKKTKYFEDIYDVLYQKNLTDRLYNSIRQLSPFQISSVSVQKKEGFLKSLRRKLIPLRVRVFIKDILGKF